jgi:hypothetical protein
MNRAGTEPIDRRTRHSQCTVIRGVLTSIAIAWTSATV